MLFLDGSIAGVSQVIGALGWRDEIEDFADPLPCGLAASFLGMPHPMLGLGEQLLDRIEVGAVGRQEYQMRASCPDGGSGGLALVGAKIVEDDDIARPQRRGEKLFNIGGEQDGVDRTIDDARGIDPVMAQRRYERQRLPVTMRHFGREPLPLGSPSTQRGHIGLDPGLVDEDEAPGVDLVLMRFPALPLAGDVRPVLLGRHHRFF